MCIRMHVWAMNDESTYHPWNRDNPHHHLENLVANSSAWAPCSAHLCSADSSHSLLDTILEASDARASTPDYPDAVLSDPWVKTYRLRCNWRTDTTYTTRPIDGHCAAVEKGKTSVNQLIELAISTHLDWLQQLEAMIHRFIGFILWNDCEIFDNATLDQVDKAREAQTVGQFQ